MATEYRLTLAGGTPEAIAERAVPHQAERPVVLAPGRLLSADLTARHGLVLDVHARPDGYVEADGDTGVWTWEPGACVAVTGRLDAGRDDADTGTHTMVDIVARLLATGTEDAALVLDGNYLLLTRTDAVVTKHRRQVWWDHYGWPNEVIPG